MVNRSGLRDGGRFNLLVMGIIYATFGLSMHFQPLRWTRTPAYHDLFQILPESVWANIYLLGAVALLGAMVFSRHYWVVVVSVTFGLMISMSWALAFVVRVMTSSNTTPETFMSFLAFSYLLVRVLLLLEHGKEQPGLAL